MEPTVLKSRKIVVHGGRIEIVRDPTYCSRIETEPVLVGRHADCQLVVSDPHVSAAHVELSPTEGGVRLRDLGSKNGTWLEGVRVVEVLLTADTRFCVGDVELAFHVDEPSRVTLPAAERFGALIGRSAGMRKLFSQLEQVGPTDLSALVLGETGTGKELVAQAIHDASTRCKKPMMIVDCGSIAPALAESLLFGHEKGAFTGAHQARVSPFIEANGGTVFLDELGELPLDVQPKLLRALAERRVKPVGSNTYRAFDARVIAATRRDLVKGVNNGSFRSDLYFRIAQLRLEIPPLRDRKEDIPLLVRQFVKDLGGDASARRISRVTLERLLRYDWPGNVRELKNAVAVAHALSEGEGDLEIASFVGLPGPDRSGLGQGVGAGEGYHEAKREALGRFERSYFAVLLDDCGGNIAEISRRAGLQRTHVRRYLKAHGLLLDRAKRRR